MKYQFSFVFVSCALALVSCTKPQMNLEEQTPRSSTPSNQQSGPKRSEVGNGGDYIQLLLEEGRSKGILMLNRINLSAFSEDLRAELKEGELEWILNNKQNWAEDLRESSFEIVEKLPESCSQDDDACAPSSKLIYFARPQIEKKIKSPKEATRLLLHETAHHFFGTDEVKVRRVTTAVFTAYYRRHPETPHWETIGNNILPHFSKKDMDHLQTVWTGEKMLAWYQLNWAENVFDESSVLISDSEGRDTIFSYSPKDDQWEPYKTRNPFRRRVRPLSFQRTGEKKYERLHSVWAGNKLVSFSDCHRHVLEENLAGLTYAPAQDSWGGILDENFLVERFSADVISTGNKLIVWGGYACSERENSFPPTALSSGGIYDPQLQQWNEIPSPLAEMKLDGRENSSITWVGDELIIWGGQRKNEQNVFEELNTGAIYNPTTRKWRSTSTQGINSRSYHLAVSLGKKLLVLGGCKQERDGAIYDPENNSWRAIAPVPHQERNVINIQYVRGAWTGFKFLMRGTELLEYDPTLDKWELIGNSSNMRFSPHEFSFWTGFELLVWNPLTRDANRFIP